MVEKLKKRKIGKKYPFHQPIRRQHSDIRWNYYYYSSSCSCRDFVRPNSQRLMIRSLLNFTGRWIPISRGALSLGIFTMATVAMETVNICKNLWPHLYRKPPKGFPQDLANILSRVGRIFWPKKIASEWPPFWNGRRQNRQNFNVLWFQWKLISRVILKWEIDW